MISFWTCDGTPGVDESSWGGVGQRSKDSNPPPPLCITPAPVQDPTSVVDVPEWRVDELSHVARPLGDVQEHRDGVIAAVAQIQQGLGQAGLPRGWLWGDIHMG